MFRNTGKKPKTVLDQLIDSLGSLDGLRTATFVTAWWMVDRRRGRPVLGPMRMEDYAAYWRCSLSTVSRECAKFRHAFPMWDRPTGLIDYMRARGHEPGLTTFDRVLWEPEAWDPEPETEPESGSAGE